MAPSRRVMVSSVLLVLACTATIEDAPRGEPLPTLSPVALRPPPAGLRTLTPRQYVASVRTVLGLAAEDDAPVRAVGQWATSVAAARGGFSPTTVEAYEGAAREIVAYVLADEARRSRLVPCAPDADGCAREVLARVGRRAYRRALTEEELARWHGVFSRVTELLGDPTRGLEHALTGVLQSPSFLYRVELGEVDGDRVRYTSHEMATRLAFLVWSSTPDDALLDLAEADALVTDEDLDAAIAWMLDDPRAREGVEAFLADLLETDTLRALEKNPDLYPDFAAQRPSLEPQLLRIAATAVREDHLGALFTTRDVFIDRALAPYYGLEPAELGPELVRYELGDDDPRRGVLTTPGVLAMHAYPGTTSPALRGLFVRRRLLCQAIPPPPPEVSTQLPEVEDGRLMTTRELVGLHQRDRGCASCHAFIDPIGLALEHFEADGSYRAMHNGLEIDPSGELDGVPFADAVELGEALAEHPSFLPCMAAQLFAFGAGSTASAGNHVIREIARDELRAMVREVARSEAFRFGWPSEEGTP
ncbi:MAG: DUF1588 domain-containing protein [Myxococcales bacterium]|nr:DUF1588 domain-containing protein [Myxococcales bacterium]